jgi:transcription-repair coupling factor (superfamily II helicase)
MDLTGLLQVIEETPAYQRLLGRPSGKQVRLALPQAARPCLLAALERHRGSPLLVVAPRAESARRFYDQLTVWSQAKVRLFLEPDVLPYERLIPDPATIQERLRVLFALSRQQTEPQRLIVVASAAALAHKTIRHQDFLSACHRLELGMRLDPEVMLHCWQSMGYQRENAVEVPGTVSRRGGILDILSPASEFPARLELLGNQVESLRLFDPATQRSLGPAPWVDVVPAHELLPKDASQILDRLTGDLDDTFTEDIAQLREGQWFDGIEFYAPLFNSGGLLDYLPPKTLMALDEPEQIKAVLEELDQQARETRQENVAQGRLPASFPVPYFTWAELEPELAARGYLGLSSWAEAAEDLGLVPAPGYAGRLSALLKEVPGRLKNGERIVIISPQAERVSELLAEANIMAAPRLEIAEMPSPGTLTLAQGWLAEGFAISQPAPVDDDFPRLMSLLTDAELFGFVKERRLVKKRPLRRLDFLSELSPGDYVVHIEHGIGRFTGLTRLRTGESEQEYLVLEYAAGDKLYVPSDQVDRVSRYLGPGGEPPALSRLGGQEWAHTKQRVRQSVRDMAKELLELYASREVVSGIAFSSDTPWQQEMEASFPYMETPDQLEAANQVKNDMEQPKPMDRLICGDVGYGKTEVAVRAAFKAVQDGKQVAILVPTTVLAHQHFFTFKQRLAAFPVTVEMLSRFRSDKEQQAIVEGLAQGSIDIVIGTHRLLQKDVVFKNLGLVIIDEEQRFGVWHKERLKHMRQEVDVLTLSATPIPRTLHMALVGVHDMSTIETPPEERLPIKTYVGEYSDRLVREAILRELERGGQVFYVHNRVQNIASVAAQLQALVPEARVVVGHGQMDEQELEAVMVDFAQGQSDVLVCTTIIESGLDMPNVNTLIVGDAHRLGLTQLYQLRGRVGRGASRAYAYFLYPRGKRLTPAAAKRLATIYEATELGAGFRIALKDLEIRGAGNLLGAEQSGHIGAVGFDLYCRMLAEAVEALKAVGTATTRAPRPVAPTIDLPLAAYIPRNYMTEAKVRLSFYQRLARLPGATVDEIAQEMIDRFGPLPAQVQNLLYIVKLRDRAAGSVIESINTEDGQIVLMIKDGRRLDKARFGSVSGEGVKIGMNSIRLDQMRLGPRWQKVLEELVGKLAEENVRKRQETSS